MPYILCSQETTLKPNDWSGQLVPKEKSCPKHVHNKSITTEPWSHRDQREDLPKGITFTQAVLLRDREEVSEVPKAPIVLHTHKWLKKDQN